MERLLRERFFGERNDRAKERIFLSLPPPLSFSSYKVRVAAVMRLRPSREIRLVSSIRFCSPRVTNSIRTRIPRDQSIEQLELSWIIKSG